MLGFVYGPVTSKTLPKMGMQVGLISATATAAKGHGSKDTLSIFGHEGKIRA